MESFRLNSKIVESGKEFFIQTVNDIRSHVIKTSLFQNGDLLDTTILPYSDEVSEEEILSLVKTAHGEKKSELEYLLESCKKILDSGQPQQMYHLGSALLFKRMALEAQQLFRVAIKFQPDYHEAYFLLSQANMALDHIDDAIDAAFKAVELRPDFADYRNNLGETYLASESCKRAIIEFEKAITANVYYADAYFNLAMAHILNAIKKEDYQLSDDMTSKSMDLLNKAILIYPDFDSGGYKDAVSALSSGNFQRAYDLFKDIRESKREKLRCEKASYFQRFLIYTDWLNEDAILERIKSLEGQIDKNPDYVDLYYDLALGYLHHARFDWQRGIEYLKRALSINNNLKKAERALSVSEKYQLKLSEAISQITKLDQNEGE